MELESDPLSGGLTINRRVVHEGRVVDLGIDTVRFPDGSVGELEMIRHSGAAAVLPLLDPIDSADPRILLIHQFRYAAGGYIYEVPAGRPDKRGEEWTVCARRELEEETGHFPGTLTFLTSILTTPGFTDELIHLFVATDLREGKTGRDVDEFMEVHPTRLSRALEMIRTGEIQDGKTICTLLYFSQFRSVLTS
jgi:ADP-ribose pyrophosphatase